MQIKFKSRAPLDVIIFIVDSPYRTPINKAILVLGEKGILHQLKKKWWQDIDGGKCISDSDKAVSTNELGLANVGGVFLVLMCGCGASLIIAICEFLWNIRGVAVREKVRRFSFLLIKQHSLLMCHLNYSSNEKKKS